ncbi:hypothetical protein [Formosa sp. PL04]|uniref:hypothetical protein n=1 Tax=Formosa sp. PL04 TaxID=3081755 RepID=UPI002982402E|nr:hypothetical protein [Formosa sp. PL04]MDW5290393.1 hypothetical protein [Formosa sp. PL04]
MKTMINLKKYVFGLSATALLLVVGISITSCDPSLDVFEYPLPDTNSQPDMTPPTASFIVTPDPENYLVYALGNTSSNATDYVWDYGEGKPGDSLTTTNTYEGLVEFPAEGTYLVTLTALDKHLVSDMDSIYIEVVEPIIPPTINPDVLNGNFDEGTAGWKPSECTDCNKNAFNASSDGSPDNYDGEPSGASKTAGAKYTSSTTADGNGQPAAGGGTRYGYQAFTVTPNAVYIVEYQYAIKTDNVDVEGGDRVYISALNGWYDDAAVAAASTPLGVAEGKEADGKGNFNIARAVFTAPASGEVSILMYAITNDELYVDNVKVYPAAN